jgi:hypothetical protein
MKRRVFLLAGLLSSTALVPAQAQKPVTVIYIGGIDCEPCTRWKKNYKSQWLASPEYKKVRWVEVDPPSLLMAYLPKYWPEELRPVLDKLPRRAGTPRFLIVRDGQVLSNQFGGNYWPVTLGDIRKYVG